MPSKHSISRFAISITLLVGTAFAGCTTVPHEVPPRNSAPYFAVNLKQPRIYPQASSHGSFAVENGCVVFKRTGTGAFLTPVFPKGTQLVENTGGRLELVVSNSRVAFDKEYRLGGGEINIETFKEVELGGHVPSLCPNVFYVVGSIGEE